MNFRKIFLGKPQERQKEKMERGIGATKQVFGWYKFDGLPL